MKLYTSEDLHGREIIDVRSLIVYDVSPCDIPNNVALSIHEENILPEHSVTRENWAVDLISEHLHLGKWKFADEKAHPENVGWVEEGKLKPLLPLPSAEDVEQVESLMREMGAAKFMATTYAVIAHYLAIDDEG